MYSAGKAAHFTVIRPWIEVGRGFDEKAVGWQWIHWRGWRFHRHPIVMPLNN